MEQAKGRSTEWRTPKAPSERREPAPQAARRAQRPGGGEEEGGEAEGEGAGRHAAGRAELRLEQRRRGDHEIGPDQHP